MPVFTFDYRLNGEPRTHQLELDTPSLAEHEAAMHLIVLHLGDSENRLVLPDADASPEQILAQAELLGLTQIRVSPAG